MIKLECCGGIVTDVFTLNGRDQPNRQCLLKNFGNVSVHAKAVDGDILDNDDKEDDAQTLADRVIVRDLENLANGQTPNK